MTKVVPFPKVFPSAMKDAKRYEMLTDVLWSGRRILLVTGTMFFVSNLLSVWSVTVTKRCLESIKIYLIKYPSETHFTGLLYSLALFISVQVAGTCLTCTGEYLISRLGLQTRHNLLSQLSKSVLNSSRITKEGSLVNAMTVDVSAVEYVFASVHFLWAAPLQSSILMVSLYQMIGRYAWIGVSVLLFYSLIQSFGLTVSKRFRQKYLGLSDERLNALKRALSSIKLIKAMSLEQEIINALLQIRKKEAACLKRDLFLRGAAVDINALFTIAATTLTILALVRYKAADFNAILATKLLFTRLRHQLNMIPIAISAWNDGKVSFDRIRPFLFAENESDESSMLRVESVPCGAVVRVSGASAKTALQNFMLEARSKLRIAYCPETPWLATGTIRDNILLGLPYDEKKYRTAIDFADLAEDLAIICDSREVGGNEGACLSGGQRARISLARAVYSQADVWILEDIFTSLDEDTKRKIIGNLSRKPEHVTVLYTGDDSFGNTEISADDCTLSLAGRTCMTTDFSYDEPQIKDQSTKMISSNDSTLSTRVLLDWYRGAGGIWFLVYIIAVKTIVHQCRLGNDEQLAKMDLSYGEWGLYLVFCGVQVVGPLAHSLFTYLCGLRSSNNLHYRAIKKIISAPYSNHTTSSLGTLTNRFSKDQEYSDFSLPIYVAAFTTALANLVFQSYGIVGKNWYMGGPVMMTVAFYYAVGSRVRRRIRGIRRDESDSRNALCSLVTDITSGHQVLRGLHRENMYHARVKAASLQTCSLRMMIVTKQVIFHLSVKLMGNLGTLLIALLSVYLRLDPSMAALAFTYSIDLPTMALWSVRQLAQTESHMVSYERIHSQMEEFGKEEDSGSRDDVTAPITLKDASLSLDGVSVLKNVSIKIGSYERVCIVGRTGSGKSSLLLSLVRLYNIEEGQISFNDIDIKEFNLKALRESIGYVSQEPICFEGMSVRYNLDPNGRLPDSELWKIMKTLHIELGLDDTVDSTVDTSDQERLNLARGFIRRSPILLLDEPLASATSSDLTELLSSGSLEEYLDGVTLIIVTHRREWQQFCTRSIHISNGQCK